MNSSTVPSRLILRAATGLAISAVTASAQLPGVPVLQNAWATPGIVAALNVGGGADGSVYAAAGAWSPGSSRFQLSAGVGMRSRTGYQSGAVYGARVAVPFGFGGLGGPTSSFGLAAFAGIGGGATSKRTATTPVPSGVVVIDSVSSTSVVPIGAAIGWRKAIGATHGLSVYATPAYVLYSGGGKNGGLFRAAIGADIGITRSLGVTVGTDFGGSRPRGFGGPSSTQYGVGVSYALGRR